MHKRNEEQAGIVSFVVTLIMMLVISLLVIGFTQVSNRTQREALDHQLSTQAQYAAESGINKVKQAVKADVLAGTNTLKDDCSNTGVYAITQALSATDNVSTTCILVNPTPSDIVVTPSQTKSVTIPLTSTAPLSSLTFSWAPEGENANASGCSMTGSFSSTVGATCTFALLRVDLMKTPATIDSASVAGSNNVKTFYLQPKAGSGSASVDFATITQPGTIVGAPCDSDCSVTFTNLGGVSYYARMSTIYRNTQGVSVSGIASGVAAKFIGIQAVIDATGKAQDVIKRIQVRYPIRITYGDAPYAVQSDAAICKRFTVGSGVFDSNCN